MVSRTPIVCIALCGWCLAAGLNAQPAATWLYINSFQSGTLLVWDLGAGKAVRQIAVEDRSGSIGATVTADGKRLFVVDGNQVNRLRIFDAATGEKTAEHTFENRELLHGGGPVVYLTPDDHFLFVNTYDYAAAASGVRVFDVAANAFLALGLRARQCAAPILAGARNGSLFAVCPRMVHELNPLGSTPPDFVGGKRVSTPIDEPAAVATSPDGSRLFILGDVNAQDPWNLVRWDRGAASAQTHNLRQLLAVSTNPSGGVYPWLEISPDGKTLALLYGSKLWMLDSTGLRLIRRVDLPGDARGVAFAGGGSEILTIRANANGEVQEAVLLRVSTATGRIEATPLGGLKLRAGPTVFLSAPAPSSGRH